MLPEHATWPGRRVEHSMRGVKEMDERMKTGRFKVANHLQ